MIGSQCFTLNRGAMCLMISFCFVWVVMSLRIWFDCGRLFIVIVLLLGFLLFACCLPICVNLCFNVVCRLMGGGGWCCFRLFWVYC